jgi:hypothetical protein
MFNPCMTKQEAEAIEATITKSEAPLWLAMLRFAVDTTSEVRVRPDRSFAVGISPQRENEMLSAVLAIVG